jgi:hypothetical protein
MRETPRLRSTRSRTNTGFARDWLTMDFGWMS